MVRPVPVKHPRVRPDVSLRPPPRPGAEGGAPPPVRPSSRPPGRTVFTAALVAGLALAAVGVFVVLPRWMAPPPRPAADAAAPAAPAPSAQPDPAPAGRVEPEPPEAIPEPTSAAAPPAVRPESRPQAAATPPAEAPGDAEWSRAMSEGLAALDRGELAAAESALRRAEAARPGTPVVADAMKRVEEGKKVEALSLHRARAAAAEAREEWRGALAEYDAALKVDPQVAFAVKGRARSLPRAELDERLAGYLQRPERLSAEAVAREAESALDRAGDVAPAGPRLQQQRAALERLLGQARTAVDVRLVSDGRTEVVVLRVGALGAFREKSLRLRPGSYVVVGRRQGYRDTRKTFVVSAGSPAPPLDVRCQEEL